MIITLFLLAQATATQGPASTTAALPTSAAEKKVCRKFTETGSFVRSTKVCRTRAEWRRMQEDGREQAREYQSLVDPSQRGG